MKYFVLFLFNCIQFFTVAQKATSSTSTAISSSSVTTTTINLNPITGNKFFIVDAKNTYAYLYSYEDFKKKFHDPNVKGDEKYIREFIFTTLENNFSKKDTLNPLVVNELNYDRFKEMFNKFKDEEFQKNNYLIVEKKTGKKETVVIHKVGAIDVMHKNEMKKGWQDEYFLSDEKTSILGSSGYKPKLSVIKK